MNDTKSLFFVSQDKTNLKKIQTILQNYIHKYNTNKKSQKLNFFKFMIICIICFVIHES
jgi:hypothetical protein